MAILDIMERARRLLEVASRRDAMQGKKNKLLIEGTYQRCRDEHVRCHTAPVWMETEAMVIECRHVASMGTHLSRRGVAANDRVIIWYTYYAHAQRYYDRMISVVDKRRGEVFSIYYNALNPLQNTLTPQKLIKDSMLSTAGILGFLLLLILSLSIAPG